MPNTRSAKKAVRSSLRKRQYNTFWTNRVKSAVKTLKRNLETKDVDVAILNEELVALQKVLDKASKKKVIHKNKANRLKSRYAKKISAHAKKDTAPEKPGRKSSKSAKSGKS